ncbi:MAG: hypothetical protein JJU00_09910 [Opitutales bacterium]|nr:hypothetical protein [Opitutales bacterium]
MPQTIQPAFSADRDSARVRLEALSRAEELSPDEVDFVVFHFTASDPGLYQPAALTAGRHLTRSLRLREALGAYAKSRGHALDEPVTLNGRRALRRILLTLAAAGAAADKAGAATDKADAAGMDAVPVPPFVLKRGPGGQALLPTAPVDLSVWLYALDILSRSPAAGAVGPAVRLALAEAPAHPAFPVYRRASWRWGELLPRVPAEERPALWQRGFSVAVERLRAIAAGGGFARGLQTLFLADGVIRAGVVFGNAGAVAVAVRDAGVSPGFLKARLRAHTRRTVGDSAENFTVPESSDPLFARALRIWGRPESLDAERPGVDPVHAEAVALVGAVLDLLADESLWTGLEPGARAFALFLAMDLLETWPVEKGQAWAMLRRAGLAPKSVSDDTGMSANGAAVLMQRIVVRCLSLEPTVPEGVFEEGLLHGVDDSALLLSLVPGNRMTPLAGGLADAFEHRLRVGLLTESGTDPEAVLGRLLVRAAHADVFAALAEVSRDRRYPKPSGGEFPLYELSRYLQDEGRRGAACSAAEGVLQRMWALRERLAPYTGPAEGAAGEPAMWAARLRDWYGFSGDGGAAREDSVFGIVRALNYRDAPMLRGGTPVWNPHTAGEWIAAMEHRLERLDTLAARMDPGCWQRIETARQAAGDFSEVLAELESSTGAVLPAPLREPFEAVLAHARSGATAWMKVAAGLAELWEAGGKAGAWSRELAERAMAHVADGFAGEVRTEVFLTVLTALRARAGEGGGAGQEDAFFAWAAAAPDGTDWPDSGREAWLDRASALWCGCLQASLDTRNAERMTALLRDPRFASLRGRPAAAGVLADCGKWAMDALRPGTARTARNHAEAAQGRRSTGRLAFAGAFLLHFSPVWIGLLIGAVLMFDFGDAWKAMAEEEQLGGILATFVLGIAGTFLYLANQQRLTVRRPEAVAPARFWAVEMGRCLAFLGGCLVFTFLATTFLWFLLSGTDEVVKGAWAVGHIVVWSGFSLVFGVFLGLVAKGGV